MELGRRVFLWLAKHWHYLHPHMLYGEFRKLFSSPHPFSSCHPCSFLSWQFLETPTHPQCPVGAGTRFPLFLRGKGMFQTQPSTDLPKSLWEAPGLFHEQGLHTWGLLVHGPQLRLLNSGPPWGTMEGEMTFGIQEYLSYPLTLNCPQLPVFVHECYSKHQLFVALNAYLFQH